MNCFGHFCTVVQKLQLLVLKTCVMCLNPFENCFSVMLLWHSDGNVYCDEDNELLDPTVECNCNCHKSGITKFFFNFILFFQKLFGSNRECACGVAHY